MLALHGCTSVLAPRTAAPRPQVTDADRAAVLDALDDATPWHRPMRTVQDLEEAWAEYTGMPYVLAAKATGRGPPSRRSP